MFFLRAGAYQLGGAFGKTSGRCPVIAGDYPAAGGHLPEVAPQVDMHPLRAAATLLLLQLYSNQLERRRF